ncbi:hypothetical protein HanXRQr2_Chr14g0637501 [Helianthus annuus]|uniref:Uncharacterized protein n=1 Tax=Helianthus annuus TaxID=4232 RepID=A0A9K3E9X9_HELAN|nr:hypothetical protein HanXRQr2_Chr14g0637501 [Helianthus annuus]KAJ0839831.1 hypothetical protein HanPSC8_Chr14g0611491 [Helianthus annuus]
MDRWKEPNGIGKELKQKWCRQHTLRASLSSNFSNIFGPCEKKPRPKGLYATIPIPSSLKEGKTILHLQVGIISSSTSRDCKDHSNCTAVIGCTTCALLMVDADASDNPTYLILPSSTSFFSSPIYKQKRNIKS